jgi:hypothetical protein
MKKYYWTMKNGQKIDVDLMDDKEIELTIKIIKQNE